MPDPAHAPPRYSVRVELPSACFGLTVNADGTIDWTQCVAYAPG